MRLAREKGSLSLYDTIVIWMLPERDRTLKYCGLLLRNSRIWATH